MIKKASIIFIIFFLSIFSVSASTDIQIKVINKLIKTNTLSFDFKQKISEKEETGKCFIKYPLLMKCNYQNVKQKIVISNGKRVAIIKKKYKKIYSYPIKMTPFFFILDKNKIMHLIGQNPPSKIDKNLITFEFVDQKENKLKIFFDKNSFELRGWKTKDSYLNDVNFTIYNLKINNQILDNFFKIPLEEDL